MPLTIRQDGANTIISGTDIDAAPDEHLNICFNGRTYHASMGGFLDFRVAVPAFEGEVEVYRANKLNPELLARGCACVS